MSDMRRWAMIAALLGLAACGQGGGGNSAASAPASGLEAASSAAHDAADKFAALAQGSETSGKIPRQTDAAAGSLLDAIFNTSALPAAPPPFTELDAVNDWLLSASRTGQLYLLAGSGATSVASPTPAVNAQADRNLLTYAPEVGRYLDAELALIGEEGSMVAQFIAANPDAQKDPTRADGLVKIRAGLAATAGGVITIVSGPGPTDAWKEARASALLALAPHAALLLTPDARASLQTQATQAAAASTDPTLQSDLTQFAAAIGPAKAGS
jgi:hypothetical protein